MKAAEHDGFCDSEDMRSHHAVPFRPNTFVKPQSEPTQPLCLRSSILGPPLTCSCRERGQIGRSRSHLVSPGERGGEPAGGEHGKQCHEELGCRVHWGAARCHNTVCVPIPPNTQAPFLSDGCLLMVFTAGHFSSHADECYRD